MKSVFLTILVLVALLTAIILSDELNRRNLFSSSGSIDNGSFAGIDVGMASADAQDVLRRRGLSLYKVADDGKCLGKQYDSNGHVEIWSDHSWRRGTVCLVHDGTTVKEIAWSYSIFYP